MRRPKPPAELQEPGRLLWKWIAKECDPIDGTEPLVAELCRISDRLCQVRAEIGVELLTADGKRNPLLTTEAVLSAQFSKLWRTLGLADKPDPRKRPVGRPAEGDKWPG